MTIFTSHFIIGYIIAQKSLLCKCRQSKNTEKKELNHLK